MRPPYLVAVVEDNPGLLADLVEFLDLRGFAVSGFGDAEAFFEAWPATCFDLLLLDVALPGVSGLEIAQRVRAQDVTGIGGATGVVMLTALDANDDHVLGLNAGADIYLSKRSSLEVIEAACHSVLRRLDRPDAHNSSSVGELWRLHARHWQLHAPNGTALDLTHTEAVLLFSLCEKPGKSVTREALLLRLGKQETLSSLRNLDNTASRLRRKVQAVCGMELPVRPSYGKGYTFTGYCEVDP
ncbi:response regulator transcription factor [Rhodanobacter sp. Col0626]|uniref:response regulator transcription factor n=1 Tax=Rhodanobacter sp. Col0626 TaxID=3415679 RepID=UPI003CE9D4DF